MHDIKMIVSDLDGTLVNGEKQISSTNLQALRASMARGIRVVLASGRSFEHVYLLARQYGLDVAIASMNGAKVDLSPDGPTLYARTFPPALFAKVFDIVEKTGLFFSCYGHNALYQYNKSGAPERAKEEQGRMGTVVTDERVTLNEAANQTYKFDVYSDGDDELIALRDALNASGLPIKVCSSWARNLEVMVENAGKDVAIAALCDHFGIAREAVMAFGDNLNDTDMLKAAGVGVAMGNALPEVKAIADLVAPRYDEDGVAHVVNEYVLKR